MTEISQESAHVLIIDDNPVNRKLLKRALLDQNHTVSVAENGQEGLKMVEEEPFDVILLDIVMPIMDGYKTLETLKGNSDFRHIPVIMISVVDEINSVLRCIEMGATDYLSKPFNAAMLRARINSSLASKRIHDLEQAHLEEVKSYLDQIQSEKEKSERLLLNILPVSIAERLKLTEDVIADNFQDVTVLFADLVGFTKLSSLITAEEVIDILDTIFSEFDALADKYGLEKIKTIGDAYMAVAGLPIPMDNHIEASIDMALEMQETVENLNKKFKHQIQTRIGLANGPVIAGVIGRKKFIYDLWGDTVNIASRMESHGTPGKIQVTNSIVQKINGRYEIQKRGNIEIKGKGEMTTYYILGKL